MKEEASSDLLLKSFANEMYISAINLRFETEVKLYRTISLK
jgi:hypothetical protein